MRRDRAAAETAFLARVHAAGGRLAPSARYVNTSTRVPIICRDEHEWSPRPSYVVTRDGDVTIALPRSGPYLVDASGDSTQVRVPETDDPARAVSRVTVNVRDGNVDISTLRR